jgi:hypothetical protein
MPTLRPHPPAAATPSISRAIPAATLADPPRTQPGRQKLARRSPPTARATAGSSLTATAALATCLYAIATRSRRTRACATAWPPCLTKSAPRATSGIRSPADRPTRRSGGSSLRVTYARHPSPVHPKGGTAKGVTPPPPRRDQWNLTIP